MRKVEPRVFTFNTSLRIIADHGRLRLILGAYTQSCPEALVFAVSQFGKPHLAFPNCSLRFNFSHTTGLTLLAVCLDSELGINVEAVRPIEDWREIARSHFSAQENDELCATVESDQQNAFFRCWTRKEALIKACGQGLSLPLDTFYCQSVAGTIPSTFMVRLGATGGFSVGAGFPGARIGICGSISYTESGMEDSLTRLG